MRLKRSIVALAYSACLPFTITGTAWAADAPLSVSIDGTAHAPAVSRYEYGMFIEPIGTLVARSLWAELLDDRKFHAPVQSEAMDKPVMLTAGQRRREGWRKWRPVGDAGAVSMDAGTPYVGAHSVAVALSPAEMRGISQTGFGIAKGKAYTGHVVLAGRGGSRVKVSLVWGEGPGDRQDVALTTPGEAWQSLPFAFTAGADSDKARFEITARGGGVLRIGVVSLMPSNNLDGWRADTITIARSLKSGFWRMPGGNFLSDWDWHDAIGPRDKRAPMFDEAWGASQTNDLGLDEWLNLARLIGTEPYLTVNAGLGDGNSAAEEVEYINGAATTYWGSKRAANGHPAPYGVKFWNIGNEPYGAWQIGVTTPDYFAMKTRDFARRMLAVDPSITLLGSGAMPDQEKNTQVKQNLSPADAEARYNTDEDWTGTLLAKAPVFKGITEHWYDTPEKRPDAPAFDELLEFARSPSNRVLMKAVEWQHYRKQFPQIDRDHIFLSIDEYAYSSRGKANLKMALAYGMIIQEMLRHTDAIRMSAHTTGTSVMDITPTTARLNAVGIVFKLYGEQFGEGVVPLTVTGNSPQRDPRYPVGFSHPKVNAGSPTWPLDVVAALSADGRSLRIGVVNATTQQRSFAVNFKGLKIAGPGRRWLLTGATVDAVNQSGGADALTLTDGKVAAPAKSLSVPPISLGVFDYPLSGH